MTAPAQPDPADELRAAAQLLRERASEALKISPIPWFIDTGIECGAGVVYCADRSAIVADRSCDKDEDAVDLPWIALMHPGVGEALGEWLETTADYYRPGAMHPTHVVRALAVARELLGGES